MSAVSYFSIDNFKQFVYFSFNVESQFILIKFIIITGKSIRPLAFKKVVNTHTSGGVKHLTEDSSGDAGEESGGSFGFDNVGPNGERGHARARRRGRCGSG